MTSSCKVFILNLTHNLGIWSNSSRGSIWSCSTHSTSFIPRPPIVLRRTCFVPLIVLRRMNEVTPVLRTSPFSSRNSSLPSQKQVDRTISTLVDVQKSIGNCFTVFELIFASPSFRTVSIIHSITLDLCTMVHTWCVRFLIRNDSPYVDCNSLPASSLLAWLISCCATEASLFPRCASAASAWRLRCYSARPIQSKKENLSSFCTMKCFW